MSEPLMFFDPAGWVCDRDPAETETNTTGYINPGNMWRNRNTNVMFQCINQPDITDNGDGTYTSENCQWMQAYILTPVTLG